MHCSISLAAAALLAGAATSISAAPASNSEAEARDTARVGIAIRYRFEHVEQDNFARDANASTARLRMNYRSRSWNGWSAFGEFDAVGEVFASDFNSGGGTSPGRTAYPLVADPKGPDLNQLFVDYKGYEGWLGRIGRQRLLMDNQRFIGGVGWRQNEQTYDALSLVSTGSKHATLTYSYVAAVRRIFGDSSPVGKSDTDAHLFNLRLALNERWRLVPYYYYLDYEDLAEAASSTATLGVRVSGEFNLGAGKLALTAETARQSDVAQNPADFDASYYLLDANWTPVERLSLGLGLESLGGSASRSDAAFRTPLATLHAFQGWADQFVATPAAGVNDRYVSLKFAAGKWDITGVFHDFVGESGGERYGQEFDVSGARKFGRHYGILLKAALFEADSPTFTDTSKVWLQLSADF